MHLDGGNGNICQKSGITIQCIVAKSSFVMYWIINWPYIYNTSRYRPEILTQDR